MSDVQSLSAPPWNGDDPYWVARLSSPPGALQLPTTRPRPARPVPGCERLSRALPVGIEAALDELARREECSSLDALLVAYQALLHRSTGQTDVVISVALPELRPLRFDLSGDPSVRELLSRTSATLAEARSHAAPDLAALEQAVGAEPGSLLQTVFALGDAAAAEAVLARVEIGLFLDPSQRPLGATLAYNTRLFEAAAAERMLRHFETLLAGLAADPGRRLSRLPLLSEAERRQILVDWNATNHPFPEDACLHQLFEEKARSQPHALAVVCGDQRLTYRELNERANQVAHHLIALGVGPEVLVGVCVERSLEMVIGLMAVSKAGGAYVPMDPSYPRERLAFMLSDARVRVLLTQKHLAESLPDSYSAIVFLDADRSAFDREPRSDPRSGVTSRNLTYVIYTSGSTGTPKGVMLDHRGRVNNFLDFNRRFSVGQPDRLIALASLSFDMCAYDVFGTLAAGAAIVAPRPDQMQEPAAWAELMRRHGVSIWHTAPAMLKLLVDWLDEHPERAPASLRLVLLGGDWIPVSLPDRLRALVEGVRVISMGGATECSMDSTIYEIRTVDPAWPSIPYGKPMANQLAYVVDAQLQPLPINVPGELYLGGIGVGRGYFNRPELTQERFVKNPFVEEPGARMYRTGDLARWMPDGNLELLGRIDNQVKIHGYRIELGEIEATLRKHPAVKEGVVVAREIGGDKRLVTYFVPDPEYRWSEGPGAGLEAEQVGEWARVYDQAYSASHDEADATFNIASWNSSYTGRPIPAEEMRAWVETTVERIVRKRPRRVLEIGCGLGLLLFRIAPSCERYVGTDISKVALGYVARHRQRLGLTRVELLERWADDFSGLEEGPFDAVVLNSIVLDFPSTDYLVKVLAGAARVLAPGGIVFVGDVRPLPLLQAFNASVQLHQAPVDLPLERLRDRVRRQFQQEQELVLDPALFQALPRVIPRIGGVRIELKRGRFANELHQFRYDVTLQVADAIQAPGADAWTEWQELGDLAALREQLQQRAPDVLCLRGVPNARVRDAVEAAALLASAEAPATAGELRTAVQRRLEARPAFDPEDFWALEAELPYRVDVRWTPGAVDGRFDVALRRQAVGSPSRDPVFPEEAARGPLPTLRSYANDPLTGRAARKLLTELRRHLELRLPPYMVPAAFLSLPALPLSPNGKVDRKALPMPDAVRPNVDAAYQPPQDAVQELLALIWAEVLGIDRVGVQDGFLELGGHSLLVVQIQTRLGEVLPFEASLQDVFRARTVAGLAERLREVAAAAGVDAEEVCRTYLDVQQMSEEEIASMATEGERAEDGGRA